MFDNDDEEESKNGSDPTGKNAVQRGLSNDDDELLLDNYYVKVNEVFNPDD